ncbi:choice-of-anchor I family protein [Hymenobacter wooponensis]|uniref:T9SS type A sorting domain-containing protein n=1 Tax=Hymenobacter wooponensis TaxID=1525360 RepID=A0A4Z0MIR8_9BACT|nr:choice-of-anchor I family protein [Hymenobacter wooponensis]TGD79359.1 T9SS type A sorting domain-containing protein [Hymenobacter wooponensis]
MRQSLLLKRGGGVLLLALSVGPALGQSVRQGFEGTAADTWTFTTTPATYNVPAENDQWAALPTVGTTGTAGTAALPAAGAQLWGMRDLEGPSTGSASMWHFLDFAPVAIQPGAGAANQVSFQFFSNAFDPSDSLAYVVVFDNGTTWPATKTYTQLNKDTKAYQTVTVPIPATATAVRLRLAARQNGNDDWAAWDEVVLGQSSTPVVPSLRLNAATAIVNETAGTVSIPVSITNPGMAPSTVEVALVPGTATAGTDFTLPAPQTLTFPAGATADQTLTIPLTDDQLAEGAEYFSLRLQNPTNATLETGKTEVLVYIKDNDGEAPLQNKKLKLAHLGSYQNGASGTNSAEIVAHDPTTQRLYVANSVGSKLDILSLSAMGTLTAVASIDVKPYGGINSVTVRNGVVACAMEDSDPQQNGSVVFLDQNGVFLKRVSVGALPDMITFSPDGQLLITANEGEPKSDYSLDPEGSVSIIDFSGGVAGLTQASVTTVGFTGFNGQAAALRQQGIRIYGGTAAAPSTVAQDLEPEYVAVSADSKVAYITLQENNAIATLDLTTKQFTNLRPVGYQDHSQPGFSLDASDQTSDVLLANWPIKGMRQPDAIATFEGAGQRYLVTANEGDAREYTALTEAVRLGDASYRLDATAFPNAALLKNTQVLGRLNVTNQLGDTDGDGDFDEIYAFGGRSFSIFNASTGALVHDSGDLLERVTSTDATYGAIFNASNSTGNPVRKNRSDDKGPEPEGVTTAVIGADTYVFVSMERVGGVMAFNVNNPASPVLETYVNNRSLTSGTGDQGPEGLVFISAANSPTGQPLLLLANEVSSTVAVYGVQAGTVTATTKGRATEPLQVYPNPAQPGRVHLNRVISGTLHDALGRPVRQLRKSETVETTGLQAGVYVLRTDEGTSTKLVVK